MHDNMYRGIEQKDLRCILENESEGTISASQVHVDDLVLVRVEQQSLWYGQDFSVEV